jgi:hypothetical protein
MPDQSGSVLTDGTYRQQRSHLTPRGFPDIHPYVINARCLPKIERQVRHDEQGWQLVPVLLEQGRNRTSSRQSDAGAQ